jgi:hypothetical protein
MAFTFVTVTHTYRTAGDVVAGGQIDFRPIVPMHNGSTVISAKVTATLTGAGGLQVQLAANTDPATTPTGTTYEVTERITGQDPLIYFVQVPHDQGSLLDLRDLAGWVGGTGSGGGSVSTINGEGPDGAGNIVLSASDVGAQPADGDLTGLAGLGDGVPRRASGTWGLVTGTPDGTKFLRDDGTWQSASGTTYTDEQVRDVIGAALVAGPNVTITPNDGADTITITAASTGSSGIPASTVNAKGDLIAGTADDTVGVRSVGTNGQALLADSAQTTGLAWGAPAPAAHTHAAADVTSGTVATARLGSGTANSSTYLRGDQTYATPSAGYDAVRDEGTLVTQRTTINFVGAGVTATDDPTNSRTLISIPGGSGSLAPGTGKNPLTGVYYANGYSGVDPTGVADSTTGINTMFAAIPSDQTIVFTGTYKITGALTQPADRTLIVGTGEGTTWSYQPAAAGTMMTITNAQRPHFRDMTFRLPATTAGAGSTLFKLSNSFRGGFQRCVFQGQHNTAGDAYGVSTGHRGVYLTDNSGDWQFIDCDFNNLGVGIQTDCVENSVLGGAFSSCYVGIYGHGAAGQSGMSVTGYVDFVSFDDEPGMVRANIWVPDTASDWWISHVWTEGSDTSMEFGDGAGTGPALVSIQNCHIAANTSCIKVLGGQGTSICDVDFGQSTGNGSTQARSVTINSTYATSGSAKNLRSLISGDPALTGGNGTDLASTVFPSGWTYIGTSRVRLANQLVGASDWVNDGGTKLAGVLSNGAIVIDGSATGMVLRDSSNKYWRVTVNTSGTLVVTGLTTTRPTT